ncbi:ribonuclease P protein subunit p20 [Cimex lectularius]|uniref:Ribonuclease P protein subunit p20 n=1 Tax=Cimex lectularius TaxID=79782 RepID=A0A8I6RVT7_CIMLE|nr:ribonuclease P protein subunit p20 [Cimex lectularius]
MDVEGERPPTGRTRYKMDKAFLRKRVPPRAPKEEGDIYVTNKSNFKGQISQCTKLIESVGYVCMHGLGAAIPRTINLALQVKEKLGERFIMDVKTSTVRITDDFEGLDEMTESKRDNSAIHVRIYNPEDS